MDEKSVINDAAAREWGAVLDCGALGPNGDYDPPALLNQSADDDWDVQ